jgi:hypothetical protein
MVCRDLVKDEQQVKYFTFRLTIPVS